MFSANISGVIKRFVYDNEEDGKDAIVKIVIESRKQYAKEKDMPNVYPLVTIFGHDAAYVRDYAGKGHWIEVVNCDMDVFRPDDAEEDRVSFKAGKVNLLPKALSEAVAETIEEDDDEDDRKKKKKKKGKKDEEKKRGKSRSERRRSRDEDEDDDDDDDDDFEEEEEKPHKKKRKTEKEKPSSKKKKTSSPKKKKKVVDEDYDDDYEDDDDDDDYFDDED